MNLLMTAGAATVGLLLAAMLPGQAIAEGTTETRDCRAVDVPVSLGIVHGTLCTPAGQSPKTVLPGSGHDLNLNPRTQEFQRAVPGWVDGLSLA